MGNTASVGFVAFLLARRRPVKILWVSRHPPLISQIKWLKDKLKKVEIIRYENIVGTAEEVIDYADKINADIIIPVLPLTIVARLVELAKSKEMQVWWANMVLLHNDEDENCPEYNKEEDTMIYTREKNHEFYRHYRFVDFRRIREVKLVLERIE